MANISASLPFPVPVGVPTQAYLDANRGPEVVAASIVLIILPTLAVTLRIISRRMSGAGFWWDDYAIMAALFFSWGPNISNLHSVHTGLGRHLEALPNSTIDQLHVWFKELYAFEFLYVPAMSCVKFSIIFFLYRIFPIIHFRLLLSVCHMFVVMLFICSILVSVFQCIPIHNFWDALGGRLTFILGGRCINVLQYFIISGSINAATDFILLALPIPLLWKLRTSNLQKLVLTAIFTVGLTVCAVSITRLILLSNLNQNDLTWNYVNAAMWTAAEPSIGVVSACLPSLRPLFARLIWGADYRPRRGNSNSSMSSGSWSGTTAGASWFSRGDPEKNHSVRSKSVVSPHPGRFNRLRESGGSNGTEDYSYPGAGAKKPWRHNVSVMGGHVHDNEDEGYDLEERERNRKSRFDMPIPANGIRVRTTVTVTERVDWQDDLF